MVSQISSTGIKSLVKYRQNQTQKQITVTHLNPGGTILLITFEIKFKVRYDNYLWISLKHDNYDHSFWR